MGGVSLDVILQIVTLFIALVGGGGLTGWLTAMFKKVKEIDEGLLMLRAELGSVSREMGLRYETIKDSREESRKEHREMWERINENSRITSLQGEKIAALSAALRDQ